MAGKTTIDIEHLEELVEQNMAFLIRTTSSTTGRYVSVEQDDAFSVALSAFAEAVERFDAQRGNFLSYAGLVIRSRLHTYMEAEHRRQSAEVSLESMAESGQELPAAEDETGGLREEIRQYQEELAKFQLSLELLAEHSPKHRDTRETAMRIAECSGEDKEIVSQTYQKKKLPVRAVSRLCDVSEKIVKTSKIFILGTMLAFVKKLPALTEWIRGTR